jgi:murein L,D-transpeptidase YcbB/YkuD
MKSITTILIITITLFLGSTKTFAQEKELKENLTVEQQKLLQEQRDVMKANREAFKASLTAEQLTILKDRSLTREQQQAALVATFSDAQKAILNENREKAKALKEEFKTTLTKEQRQQLHSQNENKIREKLSEIKERRIRKN